MTIEEINKEIAQILEKSNAEIKALEEVRDKMIKEQNPTFLNPYIKYKEDECEYVCKIVDTAYYSNGDVHYYTVKILTFNGFPYYHSSYILSPSKLGTDFHFISKEEFEELLNKGLELIKNDIDTKRRL